MRRIGGWAMSLLLAGALVGCAVARPAPPPPEPARSPAYERGIAALDHGDFAAGIAELSWVYLRDPGGPHADRALIAWLTAELDPRNPYRRPDLAASLAAARYRTLDEADWAVPVLATLYLLALEQGAAPDEPPVRDGDSGGAAAARPLPELPAAPLRDRLRFLEHEVERLQTELRAQNRELERIRRILRP